MIRGERVHGGWIIALGGIAVVSAAGAGAIAGSLADDRQGPATAHPSDHAVRRTSGGGAPPPSIAPQLSAPAAPPLPPSPAAGGSADSAAPGAASDGSGGASAASACPDAIGLRFAHGNFIPPADAATTLDPMVAYLAAHPDAIAVVDGHADPTGDEVQNLALSRRRSRRVADLLVQRGADRARVVERAFGAYVPLIGENGAAMRRVRVSIHAPSCEQEDRP